MTCPGASGCRIGSGTGAGGSAWAITAETVFQQRNAEKTPAGIQFRSKSELGGQQLGDLNRVQRRAFSQVVARQEQREPATVGHARVLADPADERVVDTGR